MIKTLLITSFTFPLALTQANAQADSAEIKKPIIALFNAMQLKDSASISQQFFKEGQILAIKGQKFAEVLETIKVSQFAQSIKDVPTDLNIEEKVTSFEIKQDGHLAMVWTPYVFYINKQVSHCGVNLFTMLKTSSGWKISSIIDTRRRDCE
jgi:hypothetical protein